MQPGHDRSSSSRRKFLGDSLGAAGGALAIGAGCETARAAADDKPAAAAMPELPGGPALDYGRSFVGHRNSYNSVRLWIESRTVLFDEQSGARHEFFQCGSCKAESTFAKSNLFAEDNYDFLPIIARDQLVIFRRGPKVSERYRDVRAKVDVWGTPEFQIVPAPTVTLLDTPEKIVAAGMAGLPIVTQTEIRNAETGLRAVIECPAKTLNLNPEKMLYQVDTGPIAFADLTKRSEPAIGCVSLGFIAFNAPDFADFVLEQPLKIAGEVDASCEVLHYSKPFSSPARNIWVALGTL